MLRQYVATLLITTGLVWFHGACSRQCQGQVQTLTTNNNSVSTLSSSGQTGGGASGGTIGGGTSAGQTAGNSQSGLTTMGTFQNLNSQNSFVGRSDAAQNAFIGRGATQFPTGRTTGQTRNFNLATGGSQNTLNQRGAGQTGPRVPEFRPQLRVAFTAAPLPVGNVSTSMGKSFDRIKERNEKLRDVRFQVNSDHSVTLQGQVESEGARKLVEFLAMLEPGIRKVNNELTVSAKK